MTFLRMDFNTVFLEKHEEYKDIDKDVQKKTMHFSGYWEARNQVPDLRYLRWC